MMEEADYCWAGGEGGWMFAIGGILSMIPGIKK